jgi:hypothetical protein
MPGTFMKGAFIELTSGTPNVILFQINPETIRHAVSQAETSSEPGSNPLAIRGMPGETFSFTLALDATDEAAVALRGTLSAAIPPGLNVISTPGDQVAILESVAPRLAALEKLLFPASTDENLQYPSGTTGGAKGGDKRAVPASQVPTVLFVWGPARILPVRVTSLAVTEKIYDAFLNPTLAEAELEVRVLTPDELVWLSGSQASIANGAYQYSLGLRSALAAANLQNGASAILGMLPPPVAFPTPT